MAALLNKRGLLFCAMFLALALSISAAALFVAGTRISSASLTRELTEMTGQKLSYKGEPTIRIFPTLTAEFKDFFLSDRSDANDGFSVMNAPVMRVSLSVLAALKGEVRVTGVTLEKPMFRAKAESNAWQLPFGSQSRLAILIRSLNNSQPQDEYATTLNAIGDNAFGTITVVNGSIQLDSVSLDLITNINSTLSWPTGSRRGGISAKGVWRGEQASLEITTDDVVMLLAGADTGVSASLASKPLTSRFAGAARLQPSPFLEGNIFAETGSLSEAMQWLNVATPYQFAALGLSLSGALKGDADKWQLEDSQVQWGTNKGIGGLIFQPNLAPPMLSGTLDFETLDFTMLTQFFDGASKSKQENKSFLVPEIGADLRISAAKASFGTLGLNGVAASLQISTRTNTLDIHDAAAFGGTLQIALKSKNGPESDTELRILGSEIETKALASLGSAFEDLPQARGSLSAILTGRNIGGPDFFETAEGTVKMRLGEGTIPGINANQMVRALRKGGFFPIKTEIPSLLSFTEINAEASLAQGTLQFAPLQIGLDKAVLNLSGAYAVKDRSIALTGTLDLEAGHPEAPNGAETLNVFFGGNRDAPLMSGLEGKP
jgi:AsmA protein